MSIPKHILQIAIGEKYISNIPVDLIKNNLLTLNPGYEYTLFTESDCINFLENNFPLYITLYNRLKIVQHKSDLIRYLYIYMNGGYYVDIDLLPTISFDILSSKINNAACFFIISAHSNEFANGLLGSTQNNSFFMDFVNDMNNDTNINDHGDNVRRMYARVASLVNITPYRTINSIFFLKEVNINHKYYIKCDNDTIVCYSNCHGYPYTIPK